MGIRKTFRYLKRILLKTRKGMNWDVFVYDPFTKPKVDLLHTFNHVCNAGGLPWIVTFESTVPRTNQTVNRPWEKDGKEYTPDKFTGKSINFLADDSCKACIAISMSAFNIQRNMLNHMNVSSKVKESINGKTIILHPPQELLCTEEEVKQKYLNIHQCIEILFVGRMFYRKGGKMIVEALEKCLPAETKFHLTIVSSFQEDNGLYMEDSEYTLALKEKLENTSWITWIKSLPNSEVLKLCKKAHVGCLPTLQDTYGYSTLEMQACGCPVITTNVRACPEINSEECGWIVPIKIDNIGGEAILFNREDRKEREEEIVNGLVRVFNDIFENPDKIEEKALNARKRIVKEHSLEEYEKKLNALYRKAIND